MLAKVCLFAAVSVSKAWVLPTASFPTVSASRSAVNMATALSQDELKKMVGYKAVDDYVTSGMVVGLGTGSTAYFAVERLGMLLKEGKLKDIVAIPTSVRTKEQAEELGIPLVTLDTHSKLDVAIDGADEVDPAFNLVKGGGGALLREKMVEVCAEKFICIVDESKLCDGLGPGFPLPVEITQFCWEHTMRKVRRVACSTACAWICVPARVRGCRRQSGEPPPLLLSPWPLKLAALRRRAGGGPAVAGRLRGEAAPGLGGDRFEGRRRGPRRHRQRQLHRGSLLQGAHQGCSQGGRAADAARVPRGWVGSAVVHGGWARRGCGGCYSIASVRRLSALVFVVP